MTFAHRFMADAPRIYAVLIDGCRHYVRGVRSDDTTMCGQSNPRPGFPWRPLGRLAEGGKVCNACHAAASRECARIVFPR